MRKISLTSCPGKEVTMSVNERFCRSAYVLGEESIAFLQTQTILIFGLGGVGSYVAEALARTGVGRLILVDHDHVARSNINRQIIALESTVGMLKTEATKARLLDINPDLKIETYPIFFIEETASELPLDDCDYLVDCIDTVSAKLFLAEYAHTHNIPLLCAMGAGNKVDPTRFEVADISKTSVCPLAKVMRTELRKRGIYHLKVVYSQEIPTKSKAPEDGELKGGRPAPGSLAFVPSVMGLIMAGQVIEDLCKGGSHENP